MRKSVSAGIGLLLALLVIPATAQRRPEKSTKDNKQVAHKGNGTTPQAAAATDDPAYVIGPEDVLDINVWKEPEISRNVPVRPDGKISLPLLNDIQAAGLTPIQLGMLITERLRKYLSDPQVTVIVAATNSQRVYILGEVNRAGAYPLTPNITVLQALSSAGLSQYAHVKNIYVLRTENGRQIKYPFNYKEVIKGQRPEQNILLKPGDTIVVP